MSTPVITNTWAGNYDCSICRRKRLMGEEFSKKSLDRYRKDGCTGVLKCKQCVAAAETKERQAAQAKRQQQQQQQQDGNTATAPAAATDSSSDNHTMETRVCAGVCGKELSLDSYNRNQWSKGPGKSRCRDCVEQAIQEEAAQQSKSKEEKILAARKKVQEAKALGKAAAIVMAESELAALEAEKVTGLKPVKLSGRGGRGRGRGGRR